MPYVHRTEKIRLLAAIALAFSPPPDGKILIRGDDFVSSLEEFLVANADCPLRPDEVAALRRLPVGGSLVTDIGAGVERLTRIADFCEAGS